MNTYISLKDLLTLLLQLAAVLAVIFIFLRKNLLDKRILKRELYQRLELASIDLFRFELKNRESSWRLYDQNYEVSPEAGKEYWEMTNHYTQILNLFEMIIGFRHEEIIDQKIFASWVPWFWEVTQTKNFKTAWHDISIHYTSELRQIMQKGIESGGNRDAFIHEMDKRYQCKQWLISRPGETPPGKTVKDTEGLTMNWLAGENENLANELSRLFVKNVTTEYISHGEVIDGRANSLDTWKPGLVRIMKKEFHEAFLPPSNPKEYTRICTCNLHEQPVGFAIIEFKPGTRVAILSDIIIDAASRGHNIGGSFISWIEKELGAQDIKFLFLESGINNTRAHRFFEQNDYRKSSVVMVKDLEAHMR